MAVGNIIFPDMKEVAGIKLGTACAGIKQKERDDLLVVEMAAGTQCAGVFTQNAFCAAPVVIARENLAQSPCWLLVNSGNANAGTGWQGMRDAQNTCATLADIVSAQAEQVLPFSTGVIGEPLPVEKIKKALPEAVEKLSPAHWYEAANAIMTTDTFAKGATRTVEIGGQQITISGIAKGAGMIQPNMATLLVFIATDAKISQPLLQQCLMQAVEQSFNLITVDGDTSTNDACILMASGCADAPEITAESENYQRFAYAIMSVCKVLAAAIIRDGEGATKLIRIEVEQAASDEEAIRVAKTIAHSPLVKTAFFASDPNWGRILAAVGRSGIEGLNVDNVVIYIGDVCIVRNGARAEDYSEDAGQKVMDKDEIEVIVSLGRGDAKQQVLTCDLSYDYVRINAEYRT
jgi:glutamate N-acetyltransferase / amino-acid N-acetyltransferase